MLLLVRHFFIGLLLGFCFPVFAADIYVTTADKLQAKLNAAESGDRVILAPGVYQGNFVVTKAIRLEGESAVIDAGGKSSAITIKSADVSVSNLSLRHFGNDSYYLDSGILLVDGADNVLIENCDISGAGFGIRGDNLNHPRIIGNKITGDKHLHKLDRGDGIYFKRVNDPYIEGNTIKDVRDGVYLETVNRSIALNNHFSHQQYGLHYMYTRDDQAWDNFADSVDGGYALMSSERIYLHHNVVSHAKDFGILLNITHQSCIEENQVRYSHNPQGDIAMMTEGKGIFIYGALNNQIRGNWFDSNDTGINMAMGGEGNQVWENHFSNNRSQVKYVGDKQLEWSLNGRGNYWDDYHGWDFDLNGIGDIAHRPNDSLDKLFWIYPEAKLLMDSPVVLLLRWLERQFASVGQSGINDSFPLITKSLELSLG